MVSNYIWVAVCLLLIQVPDFLTKPANRRPLDVWMVNPTPVHNRIPQRLLNSYDYNYPQFKGKKANAFKRLLQVKSTSKNKNSQKEKINSLISWTYYYDD